MKDETMKETRVTYTLEKDGKFYIVENVPARVSVETGKNPKKTIETPIFEFAA